MKNFTLIILLYLFQLPVANAQKAFEVEVTGKGQPIILIPGYSCSGKVWKETVQELQHEYECHVLTLAGYAGVPPISSPILESVKNEIIAYVHEKKLNKPILIGHSLGAFMSLWVSSEAPESFGKIIAVDGVPFISSMRDSSMTAEKMKANPQMDPKIAVENFKNLSNEGFIDQTAQAMLYQVSDSIRARQIATWQYESDRQTLGLSLIELSTTDIRNQLSKIQQPILVLGSVYGTKEISMNILRQQYQQAKNKEIRIADSKHFIMYDQPQWFYHEIKEFLK